MSESLLRALLRLFAMVAREDEVTRHERHQIKLFLEEHVSGNAVEVYLRFFDDLAKAVPPKPRDWDDIAAQVRSLCAEIGPNLTQKQKNVILLELVTLIQADGAISEKEDQIVKAIGNAFMVADSDIELIEKFVLGRTSSQLDHPDILIIDNSSGTLAQSPLIQRAGLKGCIAVLHLRSADIYFTRYQGPTTVYLNGVPLRSGKINVLAVGSLMRWEKDDPVYYGDILQKFKLFTNSPRLSFEAHKISYRFKNNKLGLRDVSLSEESGNLVALMGASGAGKSTLLHVLNGTEKPSSGNVLINGIDIHKDPAKIEGVIGFVPQDDLLIEDLSVYENLYYAAKLCFSNKSEQDIRSLVIAVLEDLGLAETKDLKVGSALQKTISGGQRKRLNIGLELLREPAVLFCDEPTSGLSSRDSENIIDLLKELSLKGKLVFAVIHQPSSDIFKMFDRLLILDTGGYQIYYGNPVNAIVHFKKCIDMVNSEEGECHECGNVNPEQIFNIIESKVINEYGNFTNERKMSPEQWHASFLKTHQTREVATSDEVPPSTLSIPSRVRQVGLFSLRDLKAKIHNRQYLIINLLEAPVLAFILAYIVRFYNVDDGMMRGYVFGKNLNLPAYLFMSIIVALFMGLTVSAEEIIRDRKILKRESFLHLSRSSYLLSKISILFMLSAIQTMMFVIVGSYILQIEGTWVQHWFILFTTSCFANLLGLNISSGFNSAVTIYILIPLLLIPQLILSGVVVRFDKLNPSMGDSATVPLVGDLMASRWAFEACMVSQFKDNEYEKEFYLYDKTMASADFKKIYLIPELETRLQFCVNNLRDESPLIRKKVVDDFTLVHNELKRELDATGQELAALEDLQIDRFSVDTYNQVSGFLESLKRFYVKRYNQADRMKEEHIERTVATLPAGSSFAVFKDRFHNDAISDLVKNVAEPKRIIEKDGKLVQKIYPIYKDPDPDHSIDFDAQFYMPEKHFLSRNIDTFYFNTGVIWSMSLLLAILLYFDVLRRLIDGIGNMRGPLRRNR